MNIVRALKTAAANLRTVIYSGTFEFVFDALSKSHFPHTPKSFVLLFFCHIGFAIVCLSAARTKICRWPVGYCVQEKGQKKKKERAA